jgi:hypothetical protein
MGFALAPFSKLKHDLNTYLMLKYERAGAETSHTSALPVQDIPLRGSQALPACPSCPGSVSSFLSVHLRSAQGLGSAALGQLCFLLFTPLAHLPGMLPHSRPSILSSVGSPGGLATRVPSAGTSDPIEAVLAPLGVSSCWSFHLVFRLPSLKAMTTRAVSPPHPIEYKEESNYTVSWNSGYFLLGLRIVPWACCPLLPWDL